MEGKVDPEEIALARPCEETEAGAARPPDRYLIIDLNQRESFGGAAVFLLVSPHF